MMVDMDIVIKISETLPPKIVEQELMLTGEVDIGIRPETLPLITHVAVVYCSVSHYIIVILTTMFMVVIEYDIVVMSMRGLI